MEKINVAELLRDCPQGMELDCTMYDNCTYAGIEDVGYIDILINTPSGRIRLTKEGCYIRHDDNAKCVIFPKGKTTWDGFVPPCGFKNGDIVVCGESRLSEYVSIFKTNKTDNAFYYHAMYPLYSQRKTFKADDWALNKNIRLATEEEKEKLFDAIKDNGYKWNPETKTLEKLIEPIFKVGDRIRHKEKTRWACTISRVKDRYYVDGHPICFTLPFVKQKDYELVPNKFDITTLKPFDKVLVRDNNEQKWTVDLFSFYDKDLVYKYVCVGHYVNQCIPYEENKHLLGTINDCDEYYKNWE